MPNLIFGIQNGLESDTVYEPLLLLIIQDDKNAQEDSRETHPASAQPQHLLQGIRQKKDYL